MTDVAETIEWFALFAARNGNHAAGERLKQLANEWRKSNEH